MAMTGWYRGLVAICLSLLLLISGCTPNPPSNFAQVQEETTQKGAPPAVAKAAESGSSFNQFFPKSVPGYQIVPAQEKKGIC